MWRCDPHQPFTYSATRSFIRDSRRLYVSIPCLIQDVIGPSLMLIFPGILKLFTTSRIDGLTEQSKLCNDLGIELSPDRETDRLSNFYSSRSAERQRGESAHTQMSYQSRKSKNPPNQTHSLELAFLKKHKWKT